MVAAVNRRAADVSASQTSGRTQREIAGDLGTGAAVNAKDEPSSNGIRAMLTVNGEGVLFEVNKSPCPGRIILYRERLISLERRFQMLTYTQPLGSVTRERGFPRGVICDSWKAGFSREGGRCRRRWDCARIGTRSGFGGQPGRRRMPTRHVGSWRLRRHTKARIGPRRPGSGAMDRQTLCDWVHRFNAAGPEVLIDRKPAGAARRLSAEQEAELAALIEAGPDFERAGVARWRCVGPTAADPGPLENRLSRAHDRQAAAAARVQPHLGAPAPSRTGPGRDRGV